MIYKWTLEMLDFQNIIKITFYLTTLIIFSIIIFYLIMLIYK